MNGTVMSCDEVQTPRLCAPVGGCAVVSTGRLPPVGPRQVPGTSQLGRARGRASACAGGAGNRPGSQGVRARTPPPAPCFGPWGEMHRRMAQNKAGGTAWGVASALVVRGGYVTCCEVPPAQPSPRATCHVWREVSPPAPSQGPRVERQEFHGSMSPHRRPLVLGIAAVVGHARCEMKGPGSGVAARSMSRHPPACSGPSTVARCQAHSRVSRGFMRYNALQCDEDRQTALAADAAPRTRAAAPAGRLCRLRQQRPCRAAMQGPCDWSCALVLRSSRRGGPDPGHAGYSLRIAPLITPKQRR